MYTLVHTVWYCYFILIRFMNKDKYLALRGAILHPDTPGTARYVTSHWIIPNCFSLRGRRGGRGGGGLFLWRDLWFGGSRWASPPPGITAEQDLEEKSKFACLCDSLAHLPSRFPPVHPLRNIRLRVCVCVRVRACSRRVPLQCCCCCCCCGASEEEAVVSLLSGPAVEVALQGWWAAARTEMPPAAGFHTPASISRDTRRPRSWR